MLQNLKPKRRGKLVHRFVLSVCQFVRQSVSPSVCLVTSFWKRLGRDPKKHVRREEIGMRIRGINDEIGWRFVRSRATLCNNKPHKGENPWGKTIAWAWRCQSNRRRVNQERGWQRPGGRRRTGRKGETDQWRCHGIKANKEELVNIF